MTDIRIGHGYDVHRLVEGRPLYLCGICIPNTQGLLGHSDADVAIHALMDALLGAAALGDIGKFFSDTDERYRDVRSTELLKDVLLFLNNHGYAVGNIDLTILAERPKIRPYVDTMRQTLSEILSCDISRISIKATTEEGLGFTGEGKGIAAHAVALIFQK